MSRLVFPAGDFSTNRIAAEPPTDVPFDLWTYLGVAAAASPNLVTDTVMSVVGTPVWSPKHATLTPAVNHLTPTGVLDVADQTFLFVARTQQTGGNWSPIISGYTGNVGLMIGLGWNYARIHPSGLSGLINHVFAGNYGLDWAFWSVVIDSGGATPITVKNWTHNQTVTGGTPSASRANLGQQLTLAGHSATNGTFASDQVFAAHSPTIMTNDQIAQSYLSVKLRLADLEMLI